VSVRFCIAIGMRSSPVAPGSLSPIVQSDIATTGDTRARDASQSASVGPSAAGASFLLILVGARRRCGCGCAWRCVCSRWASAAPRSLLLLIRLTVGANWMRGPRRAGRARVGWPSAVAYDLEMNRVLDDARGPDDWSAARSAPVGGRRWWLRPKIGRLPDGGGPAYA
jgi:hypothetical protein